jgi:hypothetical protein
MGMMKRSAGDFRRFERSDDMKEAGNGLVESGKALADAGAALDG